MKFSILYKGQFARNYTAANGREDLQNYYNEGEETITFDKLDLRNFKFGTHNLTKDPVEQAFDMVFCRNVMIYFDDNLKTRVVKSLFDSLNEGGFLAIGYYDSLPNDAKAYFKPYDSSKKIYRKVD